MKKGKHRKLAPKEKAERVNVSLTQEVITRGKEVMTKRAISKFSHLLAILIREEYDRRIGLVR